MATGMIVCAKNQHPVSTHILDQIQPAEHLQTVAADGIECTMAI